MQPDKRLRPFDESGIEREAGGLASFTSLPDTVPEALDRMRRLLPDTEAIVELEGARLTYQQLWDRSSAVAGGLRASGVIPGERVAITLTNGVDEPSRVSCRLLVGGVTGR